MIVVWQVEGAFIQGLGYLTSEEVVYDWETGKLISDGTWTYKIPSAACIPQKMNVEFLKVLLCCIWDEFLLHAISDMLVILGLSQVAQFSDFSS